MNDDGMNIRKCDQDGCEFPATHLIVWTKPQYYCVAHLNKALAIAEAMGFPTPAATVRNLFIYEMILDDDEGGDE